MMIEALEDALIDSLRMLPWLVVIYILLELIEKRFEHGIKRLITLSALSGPLIGAFLGLIPQCGFSVIATVFFTQRAITLGTLMAVYLSTSDEAFPVMLAQPDKAALVVPLLLVKVILALTAGYAIDFWGRRSSTLSAITWQENGCCPGNRSHCCGETHTCAEPLWRTLFFFPVKHALKIFLLILLITVALNLAIGALGEENLENLFGGHQTLQALAAVLVGLIPNCAASVAITQLFLKGGIVFGSAVAGLSASTGFGLIVLLKENKDRRQTLGIVGLLAGISFAAGICLNFFS